ncbi:putative Protein unc-45 B [Paratrimastix pyriformis]|uniref:SET domain-containing protein n=1 Tax=Paratrimastix pyriformis TaxID=342808 RepID=A0ABQ8UK44_9EUKA|nr:putative Protein unc-45 B [Paratrimastix pyriformis]
MHRKSNEAEGLSDDERQRLEEQFRLLGKQRKSPNTERRGRLLPRDLAIATFDEAARHSSQIVQSSKFLIRNTLIPKSHGKAPPIASLRPITIRECVTRCNYIHAGRVLNATIIRPPHKVVATNTLLQDDNGDVIFLAIYNLVPPSEDPAAYLPVGARVAVLEPYPKFPGNNPDQPPNLRTDNPQTVVLSPPAARSSPLESADALKARGNAAFKAGRFREATDLYTRALQADPGNTILLSNRAASRLGGGWWAAALEDARAALQQDPHHFKCACRAALAMVGLQRPSEARPYLDLIRSIQNPLSEEAKGLIADVERCCREAQEGVYDLSAMEAETRTNSQGLLGPRHCDFISQEIELLRPTPGKGRGVFAATALAEGTLLMACRALVYAPVEENEGTFQFHFDWNSMDMGASAHLVPLTVQFLMNHPERAAELYLLTTGRDHEEPADGAAVDTPRIENICAQLTILSSHENRPDCNPAEALAACKAKMNEHKATPTGLWGKPSLFNHSCAPNCGWETVGDFLFVRTLRPVPARDELCLPYVDTVQLWKKRYRTLKNLGFDCLCERCLFSRAHPEVVALEERMKKLHESAMELSTQGMNFAEAAPRHLISTARHLPVWSGQVIPSPAECRTIHSQLAAYPLCQQAARRDLANMEFWQAANRSQWPEARRLAELARDIGRAMGVNRLEVLRGDLRLAGVVFAQGDTDQCEQILRRVRQGPLATVSPSDFAMAAMQYGPCWYGNRQGLSLHSPFEKLVRRVATATR